MSALVSVDTIDYEELETEINNVFETIEKKNPVSTLQATTISRVYLYMLQIILHLLECLSE